MLNQDLFRYRDVDSRSFSPGNPRGERSGAVPGWHHCVSLRKGQALTLADASGPGVVRSFWLTLSKRTPEMLRSVVLRIAWDNAEFPSVAAPVGDFFGAANGRLGHYATPCLGISEGKGFWCCFPMPFSIRFILELHNESNEDVVVFYQINCTLRDDVGSDTGRFHAHFRRSIPPPGENHVILDTRGSRGVYVGTVISALPRSKGTWREGEFQFYIDGDTDTPTIVGTGWSDWFLSAWGLGVHQSEYAGSLYQVQHPEFADRYFCGCYRFHLMDPVYFQSAMRVEHTQIGTGERHRFHHFDYRSDDWSSVAFWYQDAGSRLPPLPPLEERLRGIGIQPWEAAALQAIRTKKLVSDAGDSGVLL